jgi:hypothetical protein
VHELVAVLEYLNVASSAGLALLGDDVSAATERRRP